MVLFYGFKSEKRHIVRIWLNSLEISGFKWTLSWVDLEWAHAHGNWAAWSSFPTHMTHGPLSCPIGDMTISSTGHEYGLMGLTMDFDVVLSGWKKFIFPGLKPGLCQMPMGCTTKYCGSIFKECMTMLWWSIKHHLASLASGLLEVG